MVRICTIREYSYFAYFLIPGQIFRRFCLILVLFESMPFYYGHSPECPSLKYENVPHRLFNLLIVAFSHFYLILFLDIWISYVL